ncbi:MAG: DNA recombination protein RmuC [Bdellovibrionota bacterium]
MHEAFPYIALVTIVAALWFFRRPGNSVQTELHHLREELGRVLAESARQSVDQMNNLTTHLNERMKETTATLQNTQSSVGQRLDSTAQVVGQLHLKLGQLEESSKQIYQLGQGLQDLKDILKNPKLRGNMGEFFLEDLLRQILPPEHYRIQHTFRSGEIVDATIRLGEAVLSVDSKFPLESFVRLVQLPDGDENKKRERKAFVTAIKRHADAIAKKYILPDEGTFDFALMYIPAENVYYETIIREELLDDEGSLYSYLLNKKVVPVSPNSLYAYLQVIVLGLRGLKVQEHAQQMMVDLQRIEGDFSRFREDYTVLGKHIKNAGGSYEEGAKRLDKFNNRLGMLTEVKVALPEKKEIHESL